MSDLDAQLLAAHHKGNSTELSPLYVKAAQIAPDQRAKCFYLTHAYVFALEAGLPAAHDIRAQLVELGSEPKT
jgi:hypothetical protein